MAGFCMGVRRAMDLTLKSIPRHGEGLLAFGPLIHNPQVLDLLREKGVEVCHSPESVKPGQSIIIRAHGIPPQERDALKARGATIIDATCPKVLHVQSIIKKHAQNGGVTVIVGDRDHPEVIGLMGYATDDAVIVSAREDVEKIPTGKPICVVAQTTQNQAKYEDITRRIQARFPEAEVHGTVCDSTQRRQDEAIKMAASVDAMVVVGGRNSANTGRLTQRIKETGTPVFQVETDDEIDPACFGNAEAVGITAGASTPNWIIQRVVRKIEDIVPVGRGVPLLFRIRQAFHFLVESDLYGAFAAGCLSYVATSLQGAPFRFSYFLIAMAYVYSMHLLNRFTDTEAGRLNDPSRAEFYEKHGPFLKIVAMASVVVALVLSLPLGFPMFFFLLGACMVGGAYSLSFIPSGRLRWVRYRRLKDIPGSKTFFIALAWGGVTSLAAPLSGGFRLDLNLIATFWTITVLVLIRSATFDLRDTQGDLMVGKETIPIVLGKRNTQRLLILLAAIAGATLVGLPLAGVFPPVSYGLLGAVVYMGYCLYLFFRQELMRSAKLEILIDSGLILQGVIAWGWSLVERVF
jgi:4-hydroxy-3-methylbut-2-enyl diphosphate reductase